MSGKHAWLNAPFARVGRFLKHCLRCKYRTPHSTSACILVPATSDAQWRKLLSGVRLLRKSASVEAISIVP